MSTQPEPTDRDREEARALLRQLVESGTISSDEDNITTTPETERIIASALARAREQGRERGFTEGQNNMLEAQARGMP